jgi:methylenetetrahydrofolate dehydrogenase (NADP+)/methenyltetrahydrofolate cyclohydrolase
MGKFLKGKVVADSIAESVKREAEELKKKGITPKLKIVRVGERKDDIAYEVAAIKRMDAVNIETEVLKLPADIEQEKFIHELKNVVNDNSVHGILVFRPLPEQIDEDIVKFVIPPEKDVDCFNPVNVAKLLEGDPTGFPPCTPEAALEILKYYKIELKGKEAVVVGRSMVVGKPISMLLLKENATVTICHSKTNNLPEVAKRADILVAAIGKSRMITGEYVKEGASVIDVGINVDKDGKITGDVNTEDCMEKAAYITPVPSGVGAVTTAVLAKHVIKACKMT